MKFLFNEKDSIQGLEDKTCIFVDGTSPLINYEKDLELSHWIPNQTPNEFKADTSTQICYNFIKSDRSKTYDIVINNHVDVDGILSAFVILFPKISLNNETIITGASFMGDFSAYGDFKTSHFYIHLVEWIKEFQAMKLTNQLIFEKCFQMIQDYFNGQLFDFDDLAKEVFSEIGHAIDLIHTQQIQRIIHHDTFVSYKIPAEVVKSSPKQAIYKSGFDFGLDVQQVLPMQVLNQFDFERQKLLIVESESGDYYYDLLLPDYLWAETSSLYRTNGVQSTDSTNIHLFNRPDLEQVTSELNQLETSQGSWTLAKKFHPFASIKGRGFPVVLSFLFEDEIVASSIDPLEVIRKLSNVL